MQLYRAGHTTVYHTTFQSLVGWTTTGEWRINAGIDGDGRPYSTAWGDALPGERVSIRRTFTLPTFGEVEIGRRFTGGPGSTFRVRVDGHILRQTRVTDTTGRPWELEEPVRLDPGEHEVTIEYEPGTEPGVVEIGEVLVTAARLIRAEITDYEPPRSTREVEEIPLLGGTSRFQETHRGGTEIGFGLLFLDPAEYTAFLRGIHQPHYLLDDIGIMYRGSLSQTDPGRRVYGLYEVRLTMHSPQQPGVGF